jgi:hypothetical protein
LYASPNIIRVIKSRRMRLAGYVVRMRKMRNTYSILVGKPERKNHSEDLGIDGKTILECILGKQYGEVVDWIHLGVQWHALVNTVMSLRVP